MHVLATAGHVDHGKSALVRALTGMEPDRWEAERRRGLTIDLGYAWTDLPGAGPVAFVDVPGHRRFIGNMLAGLGPAPAVLLVVAADSGWGAQSEEHLRAIDALGLTHGLLVISRADLTDSDEALAVLQQAAARVAESSLGQVDSVVTSARTGAGLDTLRSALARLCAGLPAPRTEGRVRLWIDRAFVVRGSGTVVTGTLGAGTVAVRDVLEIGGRTVSVRGLESLGAPADHVSSVARVAVNLRGVAVDEVRRGDPLLTPGAWPAISVIDVRTAEPAAELARTVLCHIGTAHLTARVRPLGTHSARLRLEVPLPLETGDRLILRDPGQHQAICGATVMDVRPPELRRRGDGARRGAVVEGRGPVAAPAAGQDAPGRAAALADEVGRRGILPADEARLLGHDIDALDGTGDLHVLRIGDHFVTRDRLDAWRQAVTAAVDERARRVPLDPALPMAAAASAAGIPDLASLRFVCAAAGLSMDQGRVSRPGVTPDLGAAQGPLERIVQQLRQSPFAAPEASDLVAAGLGGRELAAAASMGRVLRLDGDILLLPDAPARAMRVLAELPQPFTTSQARAALGTTRRVVIPLLEELDTRRWTRRLDPGHREVVHR